MLNIASNMWIWIIWSQLDSKKEAGLNIDNPFLCCIKPVKQLSPVFLESDASNFNVPALGDCVRYIQMLECTEYL